MKIFYKNFFLINRTNHVRFHCGIRELSHLLFTLFMLARWKNCFLNMGKLEKAPYS